MSYTIFISNVSSIHDWNTLKDACIIIPTTRFIQKYITDTFHYKINDDSAYDLNRLSKVDLILKVLYFISDKYRHVFHVDFYTNYLPIVLLLYHINYPETRITVLYILNHFSIYMECKPVIINNKRIVETITDRVYYLFEEVIGMNNIYNDCRSTKEAITELSKEKSFMTDEIFQDKEKNLQNSKMKSKFQDNLTNFENSLNITKKIIINYTRELGLSVSVFLNLMMMNDFQENIKTLCNDSFFDKINEIYEYFQNKMKHYKTDFDAAGDLNKLIFQFLLLLMIFLVIFKLFSKLVRLS